MKSPIFAERFSVTKLLALLLSLLFVVLVSSCSSDQPDQQTVELSSGQEVAGTITTQFEASPGIREDQVATCLLSDIKNNRSLQI